MSAHVHVSIKDLPQHVGEEVHLKGWVRSSRSSGKIRFLEVRDGTGDVQAIVEAAQEKAFAALDKVAHESSVSLVGRVCEEPRSASGVELSVMKAKILHHSEEFPISRKANGTVFLMRHRHLWLRISRQATIL